MEKMDAHSFTEKEYALHPFTKYVVLEEPDIVGFLAYTTLYEKYEIEYLYVEETYRKKGYGEKLLSFLIEEAIKNKAENITLEVESQNIAALSLYQKMGFEIAAIRPHYYKDGDGYLMLRKL